MKATDYKMRSLDFIEFKIVYTGLLRFRIRVGFALIRLACRVMGCGVDISTKAPE